MSLPQPTATVLLRAVADPTRLQVVDLLSRSPSMRVGEIVESLRVPQPTASRMLAYLRRARLVTVRSQGRLKLYSLAPPRTAFHRALLKALAKR